MSNIKAKITQIQNVQTLHVVSFECKCAKLKMVSLELSSSIKIGTEVLLSIKPTAVAIAKNLSGEISYSNQIKATIKDINKGELLSSLSLEFCENIIESIITTASLERMGLEKGEEITALIKANDISIKEVLS